METIIHVGSNNITILKCCILFVAFTEENEEVFRHTNKRFHYLGFEVLTAMVMKSIIFCDIMRV
jgi:hypothetical protein